MDHFSRSAFGYVLLLICRVTSQSKDGQCATTEICYDPSTSQVRAEWSGINLGSGGTIGKTGATGPAGPPGPQGPPGPLGSGSTEDVRKHVEGVLANMSRKSDGTSCSDCVGLIARISALERIVREFLQPNEKPKRKPYVSPDIPPGEIDILGWVSAPNGYQYFISGNVNYEEAIKFCRQRNATLASVGIRDSETKEFLHTRFIQKRGVDVWIGLDDMDVEGDWYWEDGVKSTSFNTEWQSGQPNDFIQREDCGLIQHSNGLINDGYCKHDRRALCER